MGQLTQTTTELQAIVDNSDAANVGKTSLTDGSDTTAVAFKKSGFYSLQGSSSNAPSTDRAVLISAIRDTAATGEIRYGQIAITESNGLWWNRDDGGSLGTWYAAVSTTGTQTLTNKTLTSPVLTTPQINDSAADHQYIFAGSNLVADRTITLPLLTGDDTFVFEAHTQTLTNKTLTSPVFNTGVSGTAVLDADDFTGASATTLATSESIKAYVDSQVGTVDTLAEVLANGNATDGTNVVVTAGDVITTDTISETTAAAGVTIDGVLLKDDGVNATNLEVTNIKANDGTAAVSIADSTGVMTIASSVLTTADINAGTIDGTVIGGTTAAAITGTAITATGIMTATGTSVFASLDISGDIDVDGTTNLDVVDIDGAVDMASTLAVGGVVTANAGVVVDTMTIDGSAIASTGSLSLDIGGNLTIDVDGTTITLADGGAQWGQMFNSAQNFYFKNPTSDKDILFQGIDGGVAFTALTLDMSNAGAATFNGNLTVNGADVTVIANINHAGDSDTYYGFHGNDLWRVVTGGVERFEVSNSGIIINDSGADADFRVESSGNANMLFVNGENDRVGVGTSSPAAPLDIQFGDNANILRGSYASGEDSFFLELDSKIVTAGVVGYQFHLKNNGTAYDNTLTLDRGNVGIGIQSAVGKLSISGNTASNEQAHATFTNTQGAKTYAIGAGQSGVTNNNFVIRNVTDNTFPLVISDAGAATFSSSVTSDGQITSARGSDTGTYGFRHEGAGKYMRMGVPNASFAYFETDANGGFSFQGNVSVLDKIIHVADTDTYLTFPNVNDFRIVVGNSTRAAFNTSEILFNQEGLSSQDFRVESSGNANMLFVDGSVDRVGVGATPMTNGSTFQVTSDSTESTNMQLTLRGASDTNKQMIMGFDTTANTAHITTQIAGSAPTPLIFKTGNVVFNEASSDSDFRVESDTNTHALFVEGSTSNVMVGKSSSSVGTVGTLIAPMQTKITNNAATPQITTNNLGWGGVSIDFLYTGARSGYINVASTSVSYVTSSDQRLKDNIVDAPSASDDIDAIQVRSFDWKADGSHQKYGMVAQELQAVAPEAVSGDADSDEMMGVDYSKLVPMLIKEIQSLRARVADLES